MGPESKESDSAQIARFQQLVDRLLPADATVLVVSKGDRRLLDLDVGQPLHFPYADGAYAGYHPADDQDAIKHLDEMRADGAAYIAFPPPSLWWLEHYREFARHLEDRHELVERDPDAGAVYALTTVSQRSEEVGGVNNGAPVGLTPLSSLPALAVRARRRRAETTHGLHDLGGLFSGQGTASGGGKLIRICMVDVILQTGGAEWFATQLALNVNPGIFEFVVVAFNTQDSPLAERLRRNGVQVIDANAWSRSGLSFEEWKEGALFDQLDRLSPDLLFFSSQYLFDELPRERLQDYPAVVRISNFHAEELARADFSAASQVICTTEEQIEAMPGRDADKTVLISTGVDTEQFSPPSRDEKEALKAGLGLEGKRVVLFVARLGDPLKRTEVFQRVARAVAAQHRDVGFLVVGYFESHNNEGEPGFREFADTENVVWRERVPPWEMGAMYRAADVLVSTSDAHEGLSNTVLQALASGVVPVVTPSAGMHELVDRGQTGFIADDFEPDSITRDLLAAMNLSEAERGRLVDEGRARITDRFSLADSAAAYQRAFMELHRRQPARISITDGYFTTGGAEWLAALLILNSDPAKLRFNLVMHRDESPLVKWLADRGVPAHPVSGRVNYTAWREEGARATLSRLRPDVVMPCTIMTWPAHEPFYRLLIISQNASDAAVLTPAQYDQADYFLCVSEDVKNHLSPDHQWKMSVLHNSIDLEMFRRDDEAKAAVRAGLGIDSGASVVLWCGRLHEARKRPDVLKEVVEDMRDDESVHFLVVGYFRGDEGDREGWIEFVDAHPNVTWVEDVAPWETARYYAAADIYLSTSGFKRSDFEGLSVATVQALATELPVVSTMSGGQGEVVEHGINGWLVEPGDVEALVDAVRAASKLRGRKLKKMRLRSREKAAESFDIRRHARLYALIARLLRDNVGTALTADPELPTPDYSFADASKASADQVDLAASFLSYTWPLLREAGEDVEPKHTLAAPITETDLAAAANELEPGDWLAVRGLGSDQRASREHCYDARAIAAVLDYLRVDFPAWSKSERRGTDLLMQKR